MTASEFLCVFLNKVGGRSQFFGLRCVEGLHFDFSRKSQIKNSTAMRTRTFDLKSYGWTSYQLNHSPTNFVQLCYEYDLNSKPKISTSTFLENAKLKNTSAIRNWTFDHRSRIRITWHLHHSTITIVQLCYEDGHTWIPKNHFFSTFFRKCQI